MKQEECNVPATAGNTDESTNNNQPDFKASEGWAQCFLQRNDLDLRQKISIAQELSAKLEKKAVRFRQDVHFVR